MRKDKRIENRGWGKKGGIKNGLSDGCLKRDENG